MIDQIHIAKKIDRIYENKINMKWKEFINHEKKEKQRSFHSFLPLLSKN